ncbi:MAG: hypothetical protein IPL53_00145 [Ignavibacteria bacterium]|nr:hypothetical protein [Ignavibacteria bacterium]
MICGTLLENTTKSDIKIYLTGTATEEKDGLIIEGKSKVFTIKPGKTNYKYNDFSGAEVKYNNGKYKEIILRTGNAPEGSYTICVTAFDENGTEVGKENCISQTVQQMGSITLLTPGDDEEIDPQMPIMFTWTPLSSTPKDGYSIRIAEVKEGKSPEEALNIWPWYDKQCPPNCIFDNKFVLPLGEKKFEEGKKYAWQVSSGDVKSEVYMFGNGSWQSGKSNTAGIIINVGGSADKLIPMIGTNIKLNSGSNTLEGTTDKEGKLSFIKLSNGSYTLTMGKTDSEWIGCLVYVMPESEESGYVFYLDGPAEMFKNGLCFILPNSTFVTIRG